MISIKTHIISEAFEQLSKSEKLNESSLFDEKDILHKIDQFQSSITVDKQYQTRMRNILDKKNINYWIDDRKPGKLRFQLYYPKSSGKIKDLDGIDWGDSPEDDTIEADWSDETDVDFDESLKNKKFNKSKLTERYSFPQVDDALNHFWNDLGKNPEVDDVIGFLEDEYPDWVPTDPDKYGKWYHDVAGEISARLSESKLTEKILDKNVYTIGIYGDEIPGFNSVRQFIEYLERKGLKIHDFDGDMDYGWDITVSGPARILYNEINNKIPGYHSASIDDFFDEYSLDELDESLKESKLTEAPMDVKDYAARLKARKAEKGQNPLEKINSQIDPDMSITDQLQVYFDELVPASGPAKTIAGELVRSIMRILYRDYNDGDLWYTGYGKETCGDSVVYLVEHIEDLESIFNGMIYKEMEDAEYTAALEDVASEVMLYLNKHPELFTTPLDKDSRSGADLESYFDLPTYEFEPDTSYDDGYYDVSDDDIDEFIRSVVESDFRGATVNRWASDGWTIEDLDKDQLEYLEDVWDKWFRDFLSQYEREEEPGEDYEDEDFDESLKESIDISTYQEVSSENRGGTIYRLFRKLENGKGKWAAIEQCNGKDCGEPFEITYEQARGFEPMNSNEKTGMAIGKKLLPKKEQFNKDNQKREKKMKIVAEDFQECNLNKMGTNEYEANTNRKKHIDMYRKFANLNEDEVITEDMIDDYALDRTACLCNREPERIKAEILGQRYSDYEQ